MIGGECVSSSLVRDALRLADLGLPVHWLWCRSKVPRAEEWQIAGALTAQVLRATYEVGNNVGIHTGAVSGARCPVVVLDIDDAAAGRYALSIVPKSPVWVRTRRGWQLYYRHPGGAAVISSRARINGFALDLRGDGGQVVCPPSIHPTGHVYRWGEVPTADALAALPVWSPEWFPPSRPAMAKEQARRQLEAIDLRTLRRAEGFAKRWRIAEENAGRGTQTFMLACTLVNGLGLDPERAYQLMAAHYNSRLPQPYGEVLLRRKMQEALRARAATAALSSQEDLTHVRR